MPHVACSVQYSNQHLAMDANFLSWREEKGGVLCASVGKGSPALRKAGEL